MSFTVPKNVMLSDQRGTQDRDEAKSAISSAAEIRKKDAPIPCLPWGLWSLDGHKISKNMQETSIVYPSVISHSYGTSSC